MDFNKAEFYEAVFNHAPEVIIILDKNGVVVDVNKKLYEWLQYDTKEVVGKNLNEVGFLPLRSRAKALYSFARRKLGLAIPPYSLDFIARDGTLQTGIVHGEFLNDHDGSPLFDIVIVSNESLDNRLKGKLLESESQYDSLLKSAQLLAYSYTRADNKIIWTGDKNGITGDPDSTFAMNLEEWEERVHPADRKKAFMHFKRPVQGNYSVLYRFKRGDGTYHMIKDSGILVIDEKGEIYGMHGILENVYTGTTSVVE